MLDLINHRASQLQYELLQINIPYLLKAKRKALLSSHKPVPKQPRPMVQGNRYGQKQWQHHKYHHLRLHSKSLLTVYPQLGPRAMGTGCNWLWTVAVSATAYRNISHCKDPRYLWRGGQQHNWGAWDFIFTRQVPALELITILKIEIAKLRTLQRGIFRVV